MEKIDWSKLSQDQINRINEIVKEGDVSDNSIREEYLRGVGMIKQMAPIESDPGEKNEDFEKYLNKGGWTISKSNPHHQETYRELRMIHECGVKNFWAKVKQVVESKKEININEVSDKISPEDMW